MARHRQKEIVLKKAKVDIGMIPVVQWLNSIDGIYTYYSCEGDDDEGIKPQVGFWWFYPGALEVVTMKFLVEPIAEPYGTLRIAGVNLCEMVFHSKEALRGFINFLRKGESKWPK